ncbi:glycosyltransferase family 2 protein [Bacteroidetes/Chlorobi group bacterium Naka2016]|jgi:glycosyltransferase involved in cell wall biosynthesis|nr:MAG: glycosyltransferase family 2 protein [Bacteroidetes/Chlorobi group bacterium Naka2016]
MENTFFSIVIATYNRNDLLARAVQSLLAQKEKDWEAIIVDDGSSDETYFYCINLCKNDTRFTYIYKQNEGPAYARESGIKLSKGRYVTFLDSDDEYEPDHLILRKRILIENPFIDFLYGGFRVIGSNFVPDLYNPNKMISIDQCVVGGTFFIRRTLIEKLGGVPKIEYGEDTRLYQLVKSKGLIVKKVDFPTYIYHREHLESRTKSYGAKQKETG